VVVGDMPSRTRIKTLWIHFLSYVTLYLAIDKKVVDCLHSGNTALI